MTEKEKEILDIIKNNPTIEQNELANLLNISRSTVAVHISSLIKQGYILGKGYVIKNEEYVTGIGAVNMDIYGKSQIKLRTHYDHPATISSSVGGVMFNIMSNYSFLGGKAKLISAYGNDAYGKSITEACYKNKIDINDSIQVNSASSGMFVQIQDENNDMFLAVCDMSILDVIDSEYIREKEKTLLASKLVIIDPSIKEEAIEEIIKICKNKVPIYVDPISDNYALKMKKYLSDISCIKPNKTELENLSGISIHNEEDLYQAGQILLNKGVKQVFISLGKQGLIYMDKNQRIKRKLKEEKKMINASGAGDALMACIIYGAMNELDIDTTIDYGLAGGIAAIRSAGTVNENMSIELLDNILKEKE